jgi:signal transduction histidine kinase
MIPGKTPSEAQSRGKADSGAMTEARSPLAQLLHALNQPLTGLQCSMEVALAGSRSTAQYLQGLRQGLVLTGRMRELVEAMREVGDAEEETKEEQETIELKTFLREVVDELEPVAAGKSICITLENSTLENPRLGTLGLGTPGLGNPGFGAPGGSCLTVRAGRRRLATIVFRLLESALSLAARGSALRVETGGAAAVVWICIRWHAARPRGELSRPELGLLVAQAGLEGAGAKWVRERTENRETVTVRLTGCSAPVCSEPDRSDSGDSK